MDKKMDRRIDIPSSPLLIGSKGKEGKKEKKEKSKNKRREGRKNKKQMGYID